MKSLRRVGRALALAGVVSLSGPALSDHEPVFVIPNPRGIPLTVDGVEVSGAVIEGDSGLYRPGHGTVTIYPGHPGAIFREPPAEGYYPATGRRPRSGRREVDPPGDQRPRPAPSYFREWTTDSGSGGATAYPPPEPTAVIVAPRWRHEHRWRSGDR